jgi:hypothetical protein
MGRDTAFVIQSAGTSMYNGSYYVDGTKNGKPSYRKVGHESASCNYSGNHWYLCESFSGCAYNCLGKSQAQINRKSLRSGPKVRAGNFRVP